MFGAQAAGGVGKVQNRNPAVYFAEKADTSVLPENRQQVPNPTERVKENSVSKETDTSSRPGARAVSITHPWGLNVYEKQRQGHAVRGIAAAPPRRYSRKTFMA